MEHWLQNWLLDVEGRSESELLGVIRLWLQQRLLVLLVLIKTNNENMPMIHFEIVLSRLVELCSTANTKIYWKLEAADQNQTIREEIIESWSTTWNW